MSNIVGAKGQVVIEKSIRDALSIRPGCIAVQRIVGDRVEITFLEPEHDRSLRGILSAAAWRRIPAKDWPGAREEAWQGAIADEVIPSSANL